MKKGGKNGKIKQLSIFDYIEDKEREKLKIHEIKKRELNYDLNLKKWK